MPKIDITDEMQDRLENFKPVIEAVVEEEIEFSTCVKLILERGLETMLEDLIGPLDPNTLIKSFQQLASKYPEEVYKYIVEMMTQGAEINQRRDNMKRRLGFPILRDANDQNK